MQIQFKRNTGNNKTIEDATGTVAGEPIWVNDKLYVGSVGTTNGGREATAGTPVLIGPIEPDKIILTDFVTDYWPQSSEQQQDEREEKSLKKSNSNPYNGLQRQGNCTFIGKGPKNASMSDPVWDLKILYHDLYNLQRISVYEYNGVAWDDRYYYPWVGLDYMCFYSPTANALSIYLAGENGNQNVELEYSYDRINWQPVTSSAIQMQAGSNVFLRGENDTLQASASTGRFSSTAPIYASGNIMSLVYGENMDTYGDEIVTDGCFKYLFATFTNLITGPYMISRYLSDNCYEGTYLSCTNLLRLSSYYGYNVLPAETPERYCYKQMFDNCTSLIDPPHIYLTTTFETECVKKMFYNCSSLNKITIDSNEWSESGANNWLYGVAASGDFYAEGSANIPTGPNGCPTGWTLHQSSPVVE